MTRGSEFSLEIAKPESELTAEMIQRCLEVLLFYFCKDFTLVANYVICLQWLVERKEV